MCLFKANTAQNYCKSIFKNIYREFKKLKKRSEEKMNKRLNYKLIKDIMNRFKHIKQYYYKAVLVGGLTQAITSI